MKEVLSVRVAENIEREKERVKTEGKEINIRRSNTSLICNSI